MQVPCVGAVVSDGAGRVLVVKRARPPGEGLWSIPGGRVEPGESAVQAVRREVFEETGLRIDVGDVLGTVELAADGAHVYVVTDFAARVATGSVRDPVAGDDAAAVRWVTRLEVDALDTTAGLVETLAAWGSWD